MFFLWLLLSLVFGFILFILILAAVSKKAYTVERSIVMNRSITSTFDFMTSIQNQNRFSKWANLDPDMKKEYRGTDRQVGFISRWESEHKQVGVGEQEIMALEVNKSMKTQLRFEKPFKGLAEGYFLFEAFSEDETKVTWGMNSSIPYPMNVMLVFMKMEKMLGNDFELGLSNAKEILEDETSI